jgi:hypothetical protein
METCFWDSTGNIPIYDVFLSYEGEYDRWKRRAKDLSTDSLFVAEVPSVLQAEPVHLILASSLWRGWGENEALEGISIVAQSVTFSPQQTPRHI